jgi:signal transduction histidine kinase
MKLYQQLILFVLAATAIPLVVGFAVLRHNEEQLGQRLLRAQQEAASRLAESVTRDLQEVFERVERALGYVDVGQMTEPELTGLMGIVYKQSETIVQTTLVDGDGKEVVPGVFLDDPARYPDYAGRLAVHADEREEFVATLSAKRALKAPMGSIVVGRPRPVGRSGCVGISAAFPVDLTGKGRRWVAGIQINLARVIARVEEVASPQGFQAHLVDSDGVKISCGPAGRVAPQVEMQADPAVTRLMAGQEQGSFLDGELLRSFAAVKLVGWGVVLTQARDDAWAEVRRSRVVTLAWTGVSILALLGLGLLFTGRITRNLRLFVAGAEAFSRGQLDVKVPLSSSDEIGLLARTFNKMGEDLRASREEIEAWNRELADRVEERTRDLEVAHRRLLETSKLAAIGQLGAGVAHEVNNPLVGILGNAQLLLLRNKDDEKTRAALQKIEVAAKRCRDVIQTLLRFSEMETETDHVACDLNQVLVDALSLTQERILAQNIEVHWETDPRLPQVLGAPRQLMQVFLNLFNNARTAMEAGGHLTIRSRIREQDGAMAEITIQDTGKGIPAQHLDRIFEPFFTTKDVWTNTGMGLSVAFRIISDHGGRIEVASTAGQGSTFTVFLPLPQPIPGGAT